VLLLAFAAIFLCLRRHISRRRLWRRRAGRRAGGQRLVRWGRVRRQRSAAPIMDHCQWSRQYHCPTGRGGW